MEATTLRWDTPERHLFEIAIGRHGHTQVECAGRLAELVDGFKADQSAVSKWVRGIARPSTRNLRAIRLYIDEAGPWGEGTASPLDAPTDAFAESVQSLTDGPALALRQAEFIDVILDRVRSRVPLSDAEVDLCVRVGRQLDLDLDL